MQEHVTTDFVASTPIRVVVVHYGAHDLTLACIEHLLAAGGPPIEVVVVDNGGGPPLAESLSDPLANVSMRVGGPTLGFGRGANLALSDLSGTDFVALVNNDVLVTPGWLEPLVAMLDEDPTFGAAAPKILLRDRFRSLELEVATTPAGRLDRRDLGLRILGARFGGTDPTDVTDRVRYPSGTYGPEWSADGRPERWTSGSAHLLVPSLGAEPAPFELLLAAPVSTVATFTSNGEVSEVKVTTEPAWHPIAVSGPEFDALHNAGTTVDRDGYGADRGYLDRDGSRWSHNEDVFAWCGAAVLMRTSYLDDIGRFDPTLFLYYEDVELAWRGLQRGWRHRYAPASVVRHVHSATAGRDPIGTLAFNERNRLLVLARHGAPNRAIRAVARTVGITLSYAARDIVNPMLEHKPVRVHHSAARIRALAGFAVKLPTVFAQRRSDAASRTTRFGR